MTTKKSNKANLEKKRGLFFQIGLIIVLLIMVGVFEVGTKKTKKIEQKDVVEVNMDVEMMPIAEKKQIKPPKPQKIQSLEINIRDDNEIIDNGKELDFGAFENIPEFIDYEIDIEEKEIEFVYDYPISIAEQMPEFYGGRVALLKYISKNVEYPIEAQENQIQGTVYLRFVVEKDGNIGEVELIRGVHELIDNEAIKVVKNMPNWKPGKQRGRNISIWFTMPIVFQLM